MMSSSHMKHAASILLLLVCIGISGIIRRELNSVDFSALERYGAAVSALFYCMQLSIIASLPFSMLNFLGVLFLNPFKPRPQLSAPLIHAPVLCFRVVTRGLYPSLVNDNLQHNIKICEIVGLRRYSFEVVTDAFMNLNLHHRSREIVVPAGYTTINRSLFKARALQYALEPDVNVLAAGDWIVHLDEETILTEDAVIGIVNFVSVGKHSFGQGVIIYGKGTVMNWITTLADSLRVGIDYGCYRFTLEILHKPIFNWKGSFIVAKVQAEMEVTFDHGPEASIAEDCYFACVAFSRGHRFGFVEGEMIEKSTFTLLDFIQQRRRWMYGILLTAISCKILLKYRVGPVLLTISNFLMPFNFLLLPLGIIWPMPMHSALAAVYIFVMGTVIYLNLLGTLKTFCIKHFGFLKFSTLLMGTLVCGLLGCVLENMASVLVFWAPRPALYTFHIVKKETYSGRINPLLHL